MRNRRNHQELWKQLKTLVLYGSKKRYESKELYKLMVDLERGQLAQDQDRYI